MLHNKALPSHHHSQQCQIVDNDSRCFASSNMIRKIVILSFVAEIINQRNIISPYQQFVFDYKRGSLAFCLVFSFKVAKMKVFCGLILTLAIFHAAHGRDGRIFPERSHQRTPFNMRLRSNVSPSIVGGNPAFIENHPWHLGLLDLSWGGYICGASNISPRWAISAAHCLEFNVPANLITLWGGSTSRLTGGITFFVDSYSLHPQYNTFTLDNDVAALFVAVNYFIPPI